MTANLDTVEQTLLHLFDSSTYQLLAVVVAVGVGAAHAVAPGHGKGITAAYLVGAHGRYRDATLLGGVVAAMHTISALVLAIAWVSLSTVSLVGTQLITQVLQALAAVVIIGVGLHLIRHRRRHHHHALEPALNHGHDHRVAAAEDHHHGGGHGYDHHDSPRERGQSSWNRRGLLALGLSGGLLPSPSAFMVLVSGLLTGRFLFAVVLVVMFGVGMAATLTGVGVATLKGQTLIDDRSASSRALTRMSGLIPQVGAYGVLTGGVVYLGVALSTMV